MITICKSLKQPAIQLQIGLVNSRIEKLKLIYEKLKIKTIQKFIDRVNNANKRYNTQSYGTRLINWLFTERMIVYKTHYTTEDDYLYSVEDTKIVSKTHWVDVPFFIRVEIKNGELIKEAINNLEAFRDILIEDKLNLVSLTITPKMHKAMFEYENYFS